MQSIGPIQSYFAWLFSASGSFLLTFGLQYRFLVGNWGGEGGYGVAVTFGAILSAIGIFLHYIEIEGQPQY